MPFSHLSTISHKYMLQLPACNVLPPNHTQTDPVFIPHLVATRRLWVGVINKRELWLSHTPPLSSEIFIPELRDQPH